MGQVRQETADGVGFTVRGDVHPGSVTPDVGSVRGYSCLCSCGSFSGWIDRVNSQLMHKRLMTCSLYKDIRMLTERLNIFSFNAFSVSRIAFIRHQK